MDTISDHIFKLYIAAMTPKTEASIGKFRHFCQKELDGSFDLKVINIMESPHFAEVDRILATPTLIKEHPLPITRTFGDISDVEKVLGKLGYGKIINKKGVTTGITSKFV